MNGQKPWAPISYWVAMKKMTIEWPSNQTTHLDSAPSSSMNGDILTASSGVKDGPIVNLLPRRSGWLTSLGSH
ncbi:hypothetical protein PGTUg99_016733 [Puccinia graminis f. sp. tritici]|uniref:Uncharacterized protein n=1 Tax=Puccinia graminis f. sp. tritici TaxID=56615 RepID=A0A5B0MVF1_PUCGR|nr:hypothetical protein PGTUg99_016733 [Puccinia graminis f. sp. tritici]